MATTHNVLTDQSSPYFLASNETANALVSAPMNGKIYYSWSRTMLMVLGMKNKISFIDGSLPRPTVSDPNRIAWDRCNKFVLASIIQSLDPSIIPSVLWMDTTFEV